MMMMMMNNNSTATKTTTTDVNNNNTGNNNLNNINGGAQIGGPKPRGRRKKVRTEPIRPICPQCEKQFSNQSALTKHKLTHSDERKFACQQCSKAFKRHDHLTGHMQTHSNRKPFNCDVQGCDKTYCDARSLRRHKENIHHYDPQQQQQQQQRQQHQQQQHNHHQQQQPQQQQQQQLTSQLTASDMNDIHYEQQHQQPSHLAPQPADSSCTVVLTPTIVDSNNNNNNYHQQHYHQQQQQQQHNLDLQPSSNLVQQPSSELYKRRLHRLHSDGGAHDRIEINVGANHLGNMGQPGQNNQHSVGVHHHHHHQTHHASYSAGYASNTTFFGQNYMHHPMDSSHAMNGTSIPHSADSVTDSVLGLNIHQYDQQQQQLTPQLTPDMNNIHYEQQQHQQPPQLTPQPVSADSGCTVVLTPTLVDNNNNYNQQHYPQEQQHSLDMPPSSNLVQQPSSELYKRRLHRLHSDGGGAHDRIEIHVGANHLGNMGQPGQNNQHSVGIHHHHHHQAHHPSYSADYATTTTFFGQNYMHHPMDSSHAMNGTSIPHSADSVTDSGLALNIHYEQPQFDFGHS